MKEFSLKEAKAGKSVCTRDGSKARIICWDRNGSNTPIIALVDCGGRETTFFYNNEGKNPSQHSELDLMMDCGKHEGWINIKKTTISWNCPLGVTPGNIWETKEDAKKYAISEDYIATIHIEWEE